MKNLFHPSLGAMTGATAKVAQATEAVGKSVGSAAVYVFIGIAVIIVGVVAYKKFKK